MGERMQLLCPDQPFPDMLHKFIPKSELSGGGRCVPAAPYPSVPTSSGSVSAPQAQGVRVQRGIPHPYGFSPPPASTAAPHLPAPLSEATGAWALIRLEAVKSHLRLY